MFTEFLRDQAFAIMWLAFVGAGWFGWAQEDPRPRTRWLLTVGSVLAVLVAIPFSAVVGLNWQTASALEGRYWIFGVVVLVECLVIGAGCFVLARRQQQRWYGWWIGLCVGAHFLPLAWVFTDWSYVVLTVVIVVGLIAMFRPLQRGEYQTSRLACPWVASMFLLYSIVSGIIFLVRYGYPV